MSRVVVDTEKLTEGLEKGIGETRSVVAAAHPEERLRMTVCGLTSAAIYMYALGEGIASQLVISKPKLPIDVDMEHVFTAVGVDTEHPVMIDASVSQFLDYAGFGTEYEHITGETIYPPEKVFAFEWAERMVLVEWLATSVRTFQEINRRPIGKYNLQYGTGLLADASYSELIDTYSAIWEPANISPWQPPREVIRDGLIISQSIPSGAIEVID